MIEQLNQEYKEAPQQPEELLESKRLMTEALDSLSLVPEIHDNISQTVEVAGELIETLEIDKSFFEDKVKATMFILAANHAARSESYKGKERASDMVLLLAKDHAGAMFGLEGMVASEAESAISEGERMRIYEKYTNTELSESLAKEINSDLLLDARKKLGLEDPSHDDPFEVRVMSISDEYNLFGISPGSYEDIVRESGLEGRDAGDHYQLVADEFSQWKSGLQQRHKEFYDEQGIAPNKSAAWVTEIEGKVQLCIMQPTAEKLLHREDVAKNGNLFNDDQWEQERHLVAHEFTHTQGIMARGELGLSVEELRAEEMAHGGIGYNEVKTFFSDIGIVTGVNVREKLHHVFENGGGAREAYTSLVEDLGVDAVLDIITVLPDAYVADETGISEATRSLSESTGGINAIVERLYDKSIRDGKSNEIEERVARAADVYEGLDDPDTYISMRGDRYGLTLSADMIREELDSRKVA